MEEFNDKDARVGFTCGAFDLLHAGHILMLAEAKAQCDVLVVGLQNDPSHDRPQKNTPVQTIIERYIQLAAVKHVDRIIVYNTERDLEDLLRILPISIRIIGADYVDKRFTGDSICKERDIEIYYNKRSHSFSTTELRKRVRDAEQQVPRNWQ